MSYIPSQTLLRALEDLHAEITEITFENHTFRVSNEEDYTHLPPFTRIAFTTKPGTGSHILNEIWLPADWNGNFLGTGNGGLAGHVAFSEMAKFLPYGFACVNTDMGTSGGRTCGCGNPDISKDFGWRSTAVMTAVGKKITEDFYKKSIGRSYFYGASTGGNQALCMAQRYPEEYDGIVAVVPAFNRLGLHTYFLWIDRVIQECGVRFTKEDIAKITAHATDFAKRTGCSEEGDRFVSRPRTDDAFIRAFVEELRGILPRLTETHLTALRKIYEGPRNPHTGEQIYCGTPIGSEMQHAYYYTDPWKTRINFYPFLWAFGADYPYDAFDFGEDFRKLQEILSGDMDQLNPDLRPFFNRGGKLFMFAGSADPVVPFPETVQYYRHVADTVGGIDELMRHARLFLVPGQDHGAQITRYAPARMNGDVEIKTAVDVICAWCERGIAPARFDMITKVDGVAVEKTIFAYGTKENPLPPEM